MKVTEIQTLVEKIQEDLEDRSDMPTTEAFQRVPRAHRSVGVPASDTRATTASVAHPVANPPVPQTSSEAFADVVLFTPSSHIGAPGDHA